MKFSPAAVIGLVCLAASGASAAQFEPKLSFTPKPDERSVALTFDACGGGFDQRILKALMDSNAKATIFVTERWLRGNGATMKVLQSRPEQFQIENHGANHVPPVTDALEVFGLRSAGTIEAVRAEVEGGARAVKEATGAQPVWYRGATARYSADALKAIDKLGFRIGGYSLNADKGASLPADMVARRIEQAKPGDVVIAHINQPHRPAGAGVAQGIRALAKSGWTFVRLEDVKPIEDNRRPLIVEPEEFVDRIDQAPLKPPAKTAPSAKGGAEPKPSAPEAAGDRPPSPAPELKAGAAESPKEPAASAGADEQTHEQPSMQIKPKAGAQWFAPNAPMQRPIAPPGPPKPVNP